ncbi:endogenous retrovirus group K member 7 Gag polyprotein-like [Saccostrea cucullata]|uniref:endogenous retrovirus group K member 7 Gag polyprotein-like n=1 Tax=Saccostrea cuccullata TaxID=36930 RepID=UPI002ED13B2C
MRGGGSTYQKKEGQGESGEKKKTRQTDPCYICKELGHWAPDCPKKDLCYKCGKFGHWANQCTEDEEDQQFVKEEQKLEKKPQEPKISGTHQTKPPVKEGDKKEKKKEENRENPGPSTTHKRKLSLMTDKAQKKKK